MAVAGDVFAVRLAGGQFGAIRILQVKSGNSLVYCSTYLDRKPPAIDDPRLRKVLRQHRFAFAGSPAMVWVHSTEPSTRYKHIGRIPPNAAERKRKCDYSTNGHWHIGDEALLEWRWIHERDKMEAEIRKLDEQMEKEKRKRLRAQKPKYMMRESRFWSLLDALDWRRQGNDEKIIEPVVRALATASVREIKGFEERMAYCLFKLDTRKHARRMTKRASDYLSPDDFLYTRCVCLVNGKKYYEDVLANPKRLPTDLEFESLLGIAALAYERKTGHEFEYETGCSYESFSNVRAWES
jgi:hypothetical protein